MKEEVGGINFKGLKVGYSPYSKNFKMVSDRRRFSYYAKKRGIDFEIARPSQTYDLLVLTEKSDLPYWSRLAKGKTKIVFQLITSQLARKIDIYVALSGVIRYLRGITSSPVLNYRNVVKDMCRRADAVVCTTLEQKKDISDYCDNIHVILDIHNPILSAVKTDYSAAEEFNLVWEGLPKNICSMSTIKNAINTLQSKHKIALHVITDASYTKYYKLVKYRTADVIKKFFDNVYFYEWNETMLAKIITTCDLAFIPLKLDDPFDAGRPENKLFLFWRMGVPAVVSATPAYMRAMKGAGLNMACRDEKEWIEVLEKYILDEDARAEAGKLGRSFVETNYNEEKILSHWDSVFKSILNK